MQWKPMRWFLRLGAAMVVVSASFPTLASDPGTLESAAFLGVRAFRGSACRYEAREGSLLASRIDAAAVGKEPSALDCSDVGLANGDAWIATRGRSRWPQRGLKNQKPQEREDYKVASGLLLRTGKVLACAYANGHYATPERAERALVQAESIALAAQESRLAAVASHRLAVLRAMAAQSMRQTPRVAEECLTKGYAKPIPEDTWRHMQGKSWHASLNCPRREELALLRVPYLGYDDRPHSGQMIVARSVSAEVLRVFAEIYRSGQFRIKTMQLIDEFGGDDAKSMAANNTSAFNCRAITGGVQLSEHSFGKAIDINPIQNPFVTRMITMPTAGSQFSNSTQRAVSHPGLIQEGDVVTKAFARIGWKWGGTWGSTKDYQHFSQSGR